MKSRLLPLVFAVLLIFTFSTQSYASFKDIQGHWSQEYVEVLSDSKLVNGYEDGTFKPNNSITKVEFFKIINQLAGYKRTYTVTFADVKNTDWYYEEVAKGIKAGYITPTTGNINPDKAITRQEAMRIIGIVYELAPIKEAVEKFTDKNLLKNDSAGYVGALVHYEIVSGYPEGNFNPNDPITRGEMSKILNLLIEKLGKPNERYLIDSEIKFGSKGLYE